MELNRQERKGPLIIISGPSGTGKSTIIRRLLADPQLRLRLSISATTRNPRPGEEEGKDYYFWTREKFLKGIDQGDFLEWAEVFGNLYGSLRAKVDEDRAFGWGVVLEIDVQGAEQVRRICPEVVSIFVKAPSLEIYEDRLRGRGTESEEAIQRRVEGARRELEEADKYTYQVVNDRLDVAIGEIIAILRKILEVKNHNAG